MDGTGFTVVMFVAMVVAFAALAVAVMISRRYGRQMFGGRAGGGNDDIAALVAELRRANDLAERRLADVEARLRRLEDAANRKD